MKKQDMCSPRCLLCPVSIFKFYLSKCPLELRESGNCYLAVIPNPSTNIWYKKNAMGINTINNLMKNMMKDSSSTENQNNKRFTNHSVRKTLVKKMRKEHLPKSEIITITGHNTEAGLDAYDSGDEDMQRKISNATSKIILFLMFSILKLHDMIHIYSHQTSAFSPKMISTFYRN